MEQLIAPLTKTIGKKPAAKDPSAAAAGGASAPTGRIPICSFVQIIWVSRHVLCALKTCFIRHFPFVSEGPEADRALDLVKSALRAVLAVNAIDDIANINRKWAEFADKVKNDEFTAEVVRALENEKAFEGNY